MLLDREPTHCQPGTNHGLVQRSVQKKGNNTKKLNMIIDLDHLAERGLFKGEMNTMTNLYKKRCVLTVPRKKGDSKDEVLCDLFDLEGCSL